MNRIKLLKEKLSHLNELKSFRSLKTYNYRPKTFKGLKGVLKIKADDKDPDLNDIDVSLLNRVGEFSEFDFFKHNNFYVDEWDVSNVKYFFNCFSSCFKFNCDLSNWDVSNGIFMNHFFFNSESFNQEINHFDLYNSKDVSYLLYTSKSFNKPVDKFKFNYKLKSLFSFFHNCIVFNQDVSMWDVSNIEHFNWMFYYTINFLQDLKKWNVSNAKTWYRVFDFSKMENHLELMPERFRTDYLK